MTDHMHATLPRLSFLQFTFATNTATILGGGLVGQNIQLRTSAIFTYSFVMTVSTHSTSLWSHPSPTLSAPYRPSSIPALLGFSGPSPPLPHKTGYGPPMHIAMGHSLPTVSTPSSSKRMNPQEQSSLILLALVWSTFVVSISPGDMHVVAGSS